MSAPRKRNSKVIALGRLGWPLRRIEQATGVRRETASAYLKAAGVVVRLPWSRPYATRIATLLLIVIVAATGAVTALGDTLFPALSLKTAIAQDFSTGSYYLLRLGILHPAMALVTIMGLSWVIASLRRSASRILQRLAAMVLILMLLQVTLGALNVVLLAPAWLQIAHLFVADVFWIAVVLLAAESLTIATA